MVGLMLLSLHLYGEVVVAGRQGGERLWDLAVALVARDGDGLGARRGADPGRAAVPNPGVRLVRGEWEAHPEATDGPVPDRARPPLPLRPPRLRPRPGGGTLGLPLPARDVRPEGEARVRLLRAAAPRRRPDRRPCRAALRQEDGHARNCSAPGATRPGSTRLSTTSPPGWARLASAARWSSRPERSTTVRSPTRRPARSSRRSTRRRRSCRSGRRQQGLRLRARREPDPDGAAGRARLAGERRARHRLLLRARCDDDVDAPGQPGRARRPDRRRLRRRLPDDVADLRAEGLPLRLRAGAATSRTSPSGSTRTRGWSGSRRRRTRC